MNPIQITTSSEMMKNHLHAELISPQAKFEALQTSNGLSLLFSLGTVGAFFVTMESSGESKTGWSKFNLSSDQIDKDSPINSNAVCKSFDAAQSIADGSINLAMVGEHSGQDYLYLSFGNPYVVFGLGHSVGALSTLVAVFVNRAEAEKLSGENPFSIPSAVLGIVSGGSMAIANFLVPRDPIQTPFLVFSL